jgi:DNA-binding SARP family transcriptional activator
LLDRLSHRFNTPVTVLVAPAGFGKTTALAQAFAEKRQAPLGTDVWLTCSTDDVSGSTLAKGLCRALDVSTSGNLDDAVKRIIDSVWHRSPVEVALIIDDVHKITPGSHGAGVLSQLLAELPRNGHLVLSGRDQPPVPLSRLEVEASVLRIGQSELIFGEDELVEFSTLRGVAVELLASSGGWPALAELLATAGPGVEAAYLWEEVLSAIPTDRRRDLALLAHVGMVDDDLASAVLGQPTDVAELTASLPLVAATAAGGREIHSLWRPHLAKMATDSEIADARRRAGVRLARTGDIATSLRLLAEADAWEEVTDVVVDALGASHSPIAVDLVSTLLDRLPDHLADGTLARALGAIAAIQDDPRKAATSILDAADAFRQDGNVAGELASMAQLGQLAWLSENSQQMQQLMTRLFEIEALGQDKAAPLACLARALIADMAADCETVLDELSRIPPSSLPEIAVGVVDWLRSTSLCHLGRLNEALVAAEAAIAHAGPFLAPAAEAARLTALWYLGHVDEVLEELPAVIERSWATGLRDPTALMAAAACLGYASAGSIDDASHYLELARRSAASPLLPPVDVSLVIAEAATAVAARDETRAAQVLNRYAEQSPPIGAGLAAFAQQRSLALWYVLVPASRPAWDRATLGPPFAMARELARRVVATRADRRVPGSSPPLPTPDVVRSVLPLAWSVELALAHVAAGQQEGWALLNRLWPQAQSDVRRHADQPNATLTRPARTALARLPVPPPDRIEVALLGPVELFRNGVLVDAPEWGRRRVRSLLAALVVRRSVGRERLAADLWPNLDADSQSRNLRVTLSHLLRVLEPDRCDRDASFFVRGHGDVLTLVCGDRFDADIWRFDQLWQRASQADKDGAPSIALDAMTQAVTLWRDDPSELAANDWAVCEVEERRIRVVGMAARAGELLLARRDSDAARQMGEAALRCDPWCERAHHVVVAAYLAAGFHRAARNALARYDEVLTALGTSPTERARRMAPFAHGTTLEDADIAAATTIPT